MTFLVKFIDSGREPECTPNPDHPNGIELDLRPEDKRLAVYPHCCYGVPYPAPRCGVYHVECETCHLTVAVTVAGRADDPRSITLPCSRSRTGSRSFANSR